MMSDYKKINFTGEQYLENIKKNIPSKDSLSVYCVVCCFYAKTSQEFHEHREQDKHKQQMAKIDAMPVDIKKKIKAFVKEVHDQRTSLKSLKNCDMCVEDLNIPYTDHKNTASHQIKEIVGPWGIKETGPTPLWHKTKVMRVGCGPCRTKRPFYKYPDFIDHCKTPKHLELSRRNQEEFERRVEDCTKESDFPAFRDGVQYGTKYVKPVKGFYCKVCKTYLLDEEHKAAHAVLQRHFNRVRDEYFEQKNKRHGAPTIDMGDYVLPETTAKSKEEVKESIQDVDK